MKPQIYSSIYSNKTTRKSNREIFVQHLCSCSLSNVEFDYLLETAPIQGWGVVLEGGGGC